MSEVLDTKSDVCNDVWKNMHSIIVFIFLQKRLCMDHFLVFIICTGFKGLLIMCHERVLEKFIIFMMICNDLFYLGFAISTSITATHIGNKNNGHIRPF